DRLEPPNRSSALIMALDSKLSSITRRAVACIAFTSVLGLTASGARVCAGTVDRWQESLSAHSRIVSNASELRRRTVQAALQRVRVVLERTPLNVHATSSQQTVVLAVETERDLRQLLPQLWQRRGAHPVGGYWAGPYRRCVVVRIEGSEREQFRRLLHEYL